MQKLYGRPISNEILADLKQKISEKKANLGLAVILIGNNSASKTYVNLKKKRAEEIGINFFLYEFSEDDNQAEIIFKIRDLNHDIRINGIIVQLPLPEKFDTQLIIESIDIGKDVDGFLKKEDMVLDKQVELEPVFPKAIMKMIDNSAKDTFGKNAIAIVNSKKFGEVIVKVLNTRNIASEYILSCDIEKELEKIKKADIIISAIGKANYLKGDLFKEDAIVIDGGISKIGKKVFGDVDTKSLNNKNIFLSPVPGGVGPVTIACLLENVYIAYRNQLRK